MQTAMNTPLLGMVSHSIPQCSPARGCFLLFPKTGIKSISTCEFRQAQTLQGLLDLA